MSVEQFLALFTALSLAILTPGPAIIAAVQTAFAHGRERALPYALGLAVGASLWCIFALLGLAVVFRLHPTLFVAMKIFGGLYLLWFAFGLWRVKARPRFAPVILTIGAILFPMAQAQTVPNMALYITATAAWLLGFAPLGLTMLRDTPGPNVEYVASAT